MNIVHSYLSKIRPHGLMALFLVEFLFALVSLPSLAGTQRVPARLVCGGSSRQVVSRGLRACVNRDVRATCLAQGRIKVRDNNVLMFDLIYRKFTSP